MFLIDVAVLEISPAELYDLLGRLAVHLSTIAIRERIAQIRASYLIS